MIGSTAASRRTSRWSMMLTLLLAGALLVLAFRGVDWNEMLATVHFDRDRLYVSQNGTQHDASTWARSGNRFHRWDPNVDAPTEVRALASQKP